MSIRYYDRRRAPLTKRLAGAILLTLALGLLSYGHQALRATERRTALLERQQTCHTRHREPASAACQALGLLAELRTKLEAGGQVTQADLERLADTLRGVSGPVGPRGPAGPPGRTTVVTVSSTSITNTTSTSTTRPPPTTTTTRCTVKIRRVCL